LFEKLVTSLHYKRGDSWETRAEKMGADLEALRAQPGYLALLDTFDSELRSLWNQFLDESVGDEKVLAIRQRALWLAGMARDLEGITSAAERAKAQDRVYEGFTADEDLREAHATHLQEAGKANTVY